MPVFLDVESRLDRRSMEVAARELASFFSKAGAGISKDLSGALGKGFGAFDSSAVRAEIAKVTADYRLMADAEQESARRMVRSLGEVEVAQRRAAEMSAKYTAESSQAAKANVVLADAQAVAARNQRVYADAMLATEGAHRSMTTATKQSAEAAGVAGRAFNALGIGSTAVLGVAMVETTRKAGDFQQQMTKLHAAAGETSENLKVVSDGILQMAGKVGYSTSELSNAMYTIEKSGFRGADGLKVLQAAAQGAGSEQADLMEVVNGLTTSMTDFNVTPANAARLMSQMVTAVGSSKASFQDFAGALHSVEPVAAAAHIKLEDLWGSIAQITQSGTSPEQATENIRNAINAFTGQSQPAREAMAQFGINADEVSQKLSERGLAGTMQYLSNTVQQQLMPGMKLNQGELFKNAEASQVLNDMMTQMSPHAAELARELKNNEISVKDYTKASRGSNAEDRAKLAQFGELNNKVDGFSKAMKLGRDVIETQGKALRDMTGTVAGQSVALQLSGEHTDEVNAKIKAIATTYTEADGTVKGFNETQDTLNSKLRDAHAAFGAAEAEIGSAFVPMMTEAAKGAKWVGDELAKHPGIAEGVTDALGLMAGAWLVIKGYDIAKTILSPIAIGLDFLKTKFGETAAASTVANDSMAAAGPAATRGAAGVSAAAAEEVAAEGRVAAAAGEADAALAAGRGGGLGALARGAAPLAAGAVMGTAVPQLNSFLRDHGPASLRGDTPWYNDPLGHAFGGLMDAQDFLAGQVGLGKADGGPINGRGPKGRDSVPMWGAPGEHVLTADDVDAMGGHGNVHAFRNALHRANGGPVGGLDTTGAQVDTIAVAQAVQQLFGISNIGMYRSPDGYNEHSSGEAADVMVGGDKALGNQVAQWALANAAQLGIKYILWQQQQWNPDGSHSMMSDRGGATQNHMDHVHIRTAGGGYPQGGGPGSGGAGSMPAGTSGTPAPAALSGGMGLGGIGGMGGGGLGGGGIGGGGGGYYTQNPERVAAAEERLRHLDQEIAAAEERKSEMKATAKQSEKDRMDEEIKHLHNERDQAAIKLQEAQRGDFHAGRGGRGSKAGMPVSLSDKFGLDKGLPGLAEWAVGFLEDLVLGPMETGIMASLGGELSGAAGDALGGALGGLSGGPLGGGSFGGGGVGSLGGGSGGGGGAGKVTGALAGGAPSGSHGAAAADLAAARSRMVAANIAAAKARRDRYAQAPSGAEIPMSGLGDAADRQMFIDAWGQMGPGPRRQAFSGTQGALDPQLGGIPGALTPFAGGRDPKAADPRLPFGSVWAPQDNPFGAPAPTFPFNMSPPHFSTGGPTGSDTVPAWLSPGEFVMNADSVKQFGPALAFMNAQHFSGGGDVEAAKSVAGAPQGAMAKPGAQAPGTPKPPAGGLGGTGLGLKDAGPALGIGGTQATGDTRTGLDAPGSSKQLFGQDNSGGGIGIGGGALGAAEGAASAAGDAFAPGSGAAAQIAFQIINRTAAYGAQMAGIGIEAGLETFLPADSPLSNFSNTLPGKILSGISGAKPAQPNTAGKTKAPLTSDQDGGGGGQGGGEPAVGFQVMGDMHVHANNADEFHNDLQRKYSGAQANYPGSKP